MSKELNKLFGKNLRKYRKKCGLTQEELASKLQVSTSFYANVECGNKVMSLESLYKLINGLGVNINNLLSEEKNQASDINDIVAMLNKAPEQDLEIIKNMVRCMLKELAKQRKRAKI